MGYAADPRVEQQQAAWLDQYKSFAAMYFDNKPYRPAYVLEHNDDADAMVVVAIVDLPELAPMMMDLMSYCSKYIDDCQVWIDGNYYVTNTKTTFSLASILENGYPRDARGKFRNNVAGNCAGRMDDINPCEGEYVAYAGMITSLMDDCRTVLDEFATTEDIIFATRDMLLAFPE